MSERIIRTRSIRLPVTDAEIHMAHELAEHAGVSIAKLLRAFIHDAHARRIGATRKRAK